MTPYKAPLRDMRFLINEVLDYPAHYATLASGQDMDSETFDAILESAAQLSEEVLAPLNQSGDREGCHFDNGVVTTPKGFKEAYQLYQQGGWQGISFPAEYGGQSLPASINLFKSEMIGTANWSFGMYPGLSLGCINTLIRYGTDEQKKKYVPALVSGVWSGTMCLTEPQCGTDLAQIITRAVPQADGSYKLTGTKIYISAGEHDLTENIVHIVLARLPDAPSGTRGISLFVVPKFNVDADGGLLDRNSVHCGAIENKMGIRASATTVLNFDGAQGYLLFEPNRGLEAMFTFMNTARIGTAVQGVCHAEAGFQSSLEYAKERRSMRALSGKKEPAHKADALIWHPDVRRMLLTQKAIAEGGRHMVYASLKIADHMFDAVASGDEEKYAKYDANLGFYTPVLKGFLTELGLESANLGMQIFGGHGYVKDYGMEQNVRDARISTLYEGTTGIQALDLLGRKVLLATKGQCVRDFTAEMLKFALPRVLRGGVQGKMARTLVRYALDWNLMTLSIMLRASKNREMVGAASVDYMMYSGYVMMAYCWAQQAAKAQDLSGAAKGAESADFYQAKIQTAEFYFARMLPRAKAHKLTALSSVDSLMQMDNSHFNFK